MRRKLSGIAGAVVLALLMRRSVADVRDWRVLAAQNDAQGRLRSFPADRAALAASGYVGIKRVFERFWRGKGKNSGGAGLGLAIVAEIMRAHHGSVVTEENPGGGMVFTLRFTKV